MPNSSASRCGIWDYNPRPVHRREHGVVADADGGDADWLIMGD